MQPALKKPCAALQACEWYRAESVFVFFFFVHIFNKELKTARVRVPRTSMYAQWSVRASAPGVHVHAFFLYARAMYNAVRSD